MFYLMMHSTHFIYGYIASDYISKFRNVSLNILKLCGDLKAMQENMTQYTRTCVFTDALKHVLINDCISGGVAPW